MRIRSALIVAVVVVLGLAGCAGGAGRAGAERVQAPGAPIALHVYPETITAYAKDDRGAYVVRLDPGAGGDAVRAELEARAGDDIVGDDGYVVRLAAAERAALLARPGVLAIAPLAPAERRRAVAGDRGQVRVELFADASADEVAAVAAWIAWRGGAIHWRGPTTIVATLPAEAIAAASRLSPVRWVE